MKKEKKPCYIYRLDSMLLLELLVLLPEGVAAVNHDLDELNLRVSQTVLVGDIIGEACKNVSS